MKSWQRARSQLENCKQGQATVMERGEEYRQAKELSDLMDRGLTLKEKYGWEKGWRLQLRYEEEKPADVLEFREQVGGS